MSGGDLFDAVRAAPDGRFPEARAQRTFMQLIQGVCYMHGRGIIHRDLSLENVMLHEAGDDGVVKIIDFGLCVDRWEGPPGLLPPGGSVGKPGYMAPEVYNDSDFDEKADLWCLGA